MGLADVLRAGVATAAAIVDDVMVDVTHEVWAGQTVTGVTAYGAPSTRRALLEHGEGRVVALDGLEYPVATKLTFLDAAPIAPKDRLTLPDGRAPPILRVKAPPLASDGTAILWEVWMGRGGNAYPCGSRLGASRARTSAGCWRPSWASSTTSRRRRP